MDWIWIFLVFGVLGSTFVWISDVRQGRVSKTGIPEIIFPLVVTLGTLIFSGWLVSENGWHYAYLYALPAISQGIALAAIKPRSKLAFLSGMIWPLCVLDAALELRAQHKLPASIRAADMAKRIDWDDPVRGRGAQDSFHWNCSHLYQFRTGAERICYVRKKLRIAREDMGKVQYDRFQVCADLAHEVKPDGTVSPAEVSELREETSRYGVNGSILS